MNRIFVYLVGVLLGTLLILAMPPARKNMDMKPTAAHHVLTSEQQWFNVSRPLTPEDLQGRVILIDFWTFCCINCMHVMPDLKKLEAEFGDKLTVIGVHSGKFFNERDGDMIQSAVLRHELEHPVVNDAGFSIWKNFGARAWPTLMLIGPLGKIERVYSGEGHYQDLRADILHLLEKNEGRVNAQKLPIALEREKAPSMFFDFPSKLVYAPDRQFLFVSDTGNHRIIGLDLEGRVKLTIGSGKRGRADGAFASAEFQMPQGLLYHNGELFVADSENHLLRRIDLMTKTVETIAGTGMQGHVYHVENAPALTTAIATPWDLTRSADGKEIIIAMAGTHQLWGYDSANKTLRVIAGNGMESIDDGGYPQNSLSQPSGISRLGDRLYFVDSETSALRVLEKENIHTLVGTALFDFGLKDGVGKQAQMQHPIGIFADESGIYIADTYNHAIRRYDPQTQQLSTLVGNGDAGFVDGDFSKARFNEPNGLVKIGHKLYVTDTNNHQIRVVDVLQKKVSTLYIHVPTDAELITCEDGVCRPRLVKN
ncbi:MAG: hypothetical protein HY540_06140 [Deltaproteobacteria bacterium]|nr:hypothetical protein [Deltaproteobacteria bacterium]